MEYYDQREGGMPIVVDEKIVGAIGVSGVTAQQDFRIGAFAPDDVTRALAP
jgi:uncharacterized protein GlcG (DUF336 family)